MVNFVMVAGAWLGAWAWDAVVPALRAAGHGAYPLTLSGLAEKQGVPAGQQTHVRDVVAEVERLDLRDVVLVGHSYSGIPMGQAAQLIGDRLARVVFLDAEVPVDGEPFASARVRTAIEENGGFWPPLTAEEYEGQGLTPEQVARITAGSVPHPGASLIEPAALHGEPADLPATYVKCLLDWPEPGPEVARLLESPSWRLVTMDTGHWPMFSQPEELARLLLAEAGDGALPPW
ncbi:alpha/beta hydrolase [Streptomyces sp. NPDC047097]|uniref:alpha/beta fold hydrolase n=1 Tax=Streptomyces sp. NPDC047097 TaxID=3155260 RepID=UPI0033DE6878